MSDEDYAYKLHLKLNEGMSDSQIEEFMLQKNKPEIYSLRNFRDSDFYTTINTNNNMFQSLFNTFLSPTNINQPSSNTIFSDQSLFSSNSLLENLINTITPIIRPQTNQEDVTVTLTNDALDGLQEKLYKDLNLTGDNQCSICIDKFKDDDNIIELDCKHIYHPKCIKTWLSEYNNKCPICKKVSGKSKPNY